LPGSKPLLLWHGVTDDATGNADAQPYSENSYLVRTDVTGIGGTPRARACCQGAYTPSSPQLQMVTLSRRHGGNGITSDQHGGCSITRDYVSLVGVTVQLAGCGFAGHTLNKAPNRTAARRGAGSVGVPPFCRPRQPTTCADETAGWLLPEEVSRRCGGGDSSAQACRWRYSLAESVGA
jgi:hypothetical protein